MEAAFAVVVVLALGFAFVNGFHDTGITVGNAIVTRALSRRVAFALAAVFNFAGALAGQGITEHLITHLLGGAIDSGRVMLVIIAGIIGALIVNVGTYFLGLPISSTHCLIGGMIGAGLVFGVADGAFADLRQSLLILLVSPLIAVSLALIATTIVLPLLRNRAPKPLFRFTRQVDSVFVAALAFAHGAQDAQKIGAVLAIALSATVHGTAGDVQASRTWWIILLVAIALAAGTCLSGTRVAYTMSSRLVSMDPPRAAIADGVSALVLYLSAFALRVPLATSFVVAGANLGTQIGRRRSRVHFGAAIAVAGAWLLGLPAAALCAAIASWPILTAVG